MKRRLTIAKRSRAKTEESKPPQIFVRQGWGRYARAHIRVKAGLYNYLVWRDEEHIRSLYLGRKRKA
jgi:hypothetical protein